MACSIQRHCLKRSIPPRAGSVDTPIFYIAFYDQERDELDISGMCWKTACTASARALGFGYWSRGADLCVIASRSAPTNTRPSVTDVAAATPFVGLRDARRWLGVPLLARDRLIGVNERAHLPRGLSLQR